MKWFRKMYVWAMNVKMFMALYFIVMVFIVGVVTLFSGGESIGLWTLLEMLLTSALVALLQRLLLSDSTDYSHGVLFGRSLMWTALSVGLSTALAALLNWFGGYPWWSLLLFAAFMALVLMLTLLGLKFEQDADTLRLNDGLKRFKAQNP